jgi:hypothetical protein
MDETLDHSMSVDDDQSIRSITVSLIGPINSSVNKSWVEYVDKEIEIIRISQGVVKHRASIPWRHRQLKQDRMVRRFIRIARLSGASSASLVLRLIRSNIRETSKWIIKLRLGF